MCAAFMLVVNCLQASRLNLLSAVNAVIMLGLAIALLMKNSSIAAGFSGANLIAYTVFAVVSRATVDVFCVIYSLALESLVVIFVLSVRKNKTAEKFGVIPGVLFSLATIVDWIQLKYFSDILSVWEDILLDVFLAVGFIFIGAWLKKETSE